MNCKHCGNNFFGKNEMFCSPKCYKDHIKNLDEKAKEATKNDESHTQNNQ